MIYFSTIDTFSSPCFVSSFNFMSSMMIYNCHPKTKLQHPLTHTNIYYDKNVSFIVMSKIWWERAWLALDLVIQNEKQVYWPWENHYATSLSTICLIKMAGILHILLFISNFTPMPAFDYWTSDYQNMTSFFILLSVVASGWRLIKQARNTPLKKEGNVSISQA